MQVFQETSFEKVGINNQGSVSSDSKDIYSCGQPCTVLGFALVWWWGAGTPLVLFQGLPSRSF